PVSRFAIGRDLLWDQVIAAVDGVAIEQRDLSPEIAEMLEPLGLGQADRGGELAHSVIEAKLVVAAIARVLKEILIDPDAPVVAGERLVAEAAEFANALGKTLIVGDDHAAVTGRDVLGRIQAVARDRKQRCDGL